MLNAAPMLTPLLEQLSGTVHVQSSRVRIRAATTSWHKNHKKQ